MGTKANNYIIILFVCVIAVTLLFIFFIFKSLPLETNKVGVRFIVGESPGFDLNSSEIVFGRVPPGGGSLRKITLGNQHNTTVVIRAYVSKDIAPFVRIDSPIILSPYNSTTLPVSLSVPDGTPFGNYSGHITFETRRK